VYLIMVKERSSDGAKFGAIRRINNYLRLKFRRVFCMWHRMWLMRKDSSFSLRAMRFHNNGRVHGSRRLHANWLHCQRMWFRWFTCYQLCGNCSWKGVTNFKIILFDSPLTLVYSCHFALYFLMEKNVKDRGRKSLNIAEE